LTLRSTGDKERDKRRIKTLYGTLISFHGHDRFSFLIPPGKDGEGHLIDFPQDTTALALKKIDGRGSLENRRAQVSIEK